MAADGKGYAAVTERVWSQLEQVLRQADGLLRPVGSAQHVRQHVIADDATLFQLVEKAQVDVHVVDDCADGAVYDRSVIRLRFSHGRWRLGSFRFAYRRYFSHCIASTSNYGLKNDEMNE